MFSKVTIKQVPDEYSTDIHLETTHKKTISKVKNKNVINILYIYMHIYLAVVLQISSYGREIRFLQHTTRERY